MTDQTAPSNNDCIRSQSPRADLARAQLLTIANAHRSTAEEAGLADARIVRRCRTDGLVGVRITHAPQGATR